MSRSPLIAAAFLPLLVGGCSVAASPEPRFATGGPNSPTSEPRASTDDLVSPSATTAAGEPSAPAGWSRVPDPFGDPSAATWLDGVVARGSQVVAFGRVRAPGRNQLNELAAVFLSDNGHTWRPVPIDAGVGPDDGASISLLAAGRRGLVAFGNTCCTVEEQASWYSPDGEAWERVPLAPSVFDGFEIATLRAAESGFVAAGSQAGRAAIATSTDGRSWQAVAAAQAGLGEGAVSDVVQVDDRWLAAGYQDDGETYDGALWESDDSVQWRPLSTDSVFEGELDTVLWRLFASNGGLLLIGNEGPNDERIACERLVGRTASSGLMLPSGAPSPATISCGWGIETHWSSSDGLSWERLPSRFPPPGEPPPTGPGLIEFRLITSGPNGLLNLGEDREGGVFLWTSSDGRDWERVGGKAIGSGDMASGIAVLDGRVIAVGDAWDMNSGEPSEPGVWIGPVP